MSSRAVSTVDHGHLDVRLSYQAAGEGKTGRARADNQIISINEHLLAPRLRATSTTLAPRGVRAVV
jgi:hypothetical protein